MHLSRRLVLTGHLLLWLVDAHAATNEEDAARRALTAKLLSTYNKAEVPRNGPGEPVNVTLSMWPYDILYVNEAKSSIKISGWIDMRWTDAFLNWKPEDHANITHLFIPASQLWLPSVDIYYSKEEGARPKDCTDCYAMIDNNGLILRGFYFVYSFPCAIFVKYFPFDKQTCTLEIANWFLDDEMMDLYPHAGRNIDLSVFLPNEEWTLTNMEVIRKREYFNYGYFPILAFNLHIKRKPFFYICNLVLPSFFLALTAVVGYHMPSSGSGVHAEKVKIGLTTIMAIFILQLGIVDKMPRSADVIPLISIYYSCLVTILSSAIIATSFIILVEKQGIYGKPVPVWVSRYVLRERTVKPSKSASTLSNISNIPTAHVLEAHANGSTLHGCASPHVRLLKRRSRSRGPHDDEELRSLTTSLSTNAQSPLPGDATTLSTTAVYRSPASPLITGCSAPAFQTLGEDITKLHEVLALLDNELKTRKTRTQIVSQWRHLADVVERCSLVIFVTLIVSTLLMFFFHDWY